MQLSVKRTRCSVEAIARRVGRRQVKLSLVDAVRRDDEQRVPANVTEQLHVVLRDAELAHHVELPDDVGFILVLVRLRLEGPVVLAVEEALGVEADDLAAARDEPDPVPVGARRAANALERPVVHAARGQFFA
jgi:hypothetical protein